ncbi:MAG: DUF4197 domain-containing protein [Rhodospirillales bacterium]
MKHLLIAVVTVAILGGNAWAQESIFGTLKDALGGAAGSGEASTATGAAGSLSTDDMVAGLREALRVGSERVVGRIGALDGFNADPDIHIPLPPALQDVQEKLAMIGMSGLADELELKLNRAAEKAAPQTKALIWEAISEMSLDDARKIYEGPEDAATRYFERTSSDNLADVIRPIVDDSLAEVGAIRAYDDMMGHYAAIPFVPDIKANLSDHTVQLTLDGLFYYLAKEEAGIRQDPIKRTTDLLTRVFGS